MTYRDLFRRLNRDGIEYVVPRKYDDLPEATVNDDGDVDMVIRRHQFDDGVRMCESVGFSQNEGRFSGRLQLLRRAVLNPKTAANLLKQSPSKSVRQFVTGDEMFENPRHENVKLYKDDMMLDLRNNLAYRTPRGGVRIPVDPSVTRGMLARREKQDCFYRPAPSDELAHLIAHCVFNKDGTFPPYYVDRCNSLYARVRSDEEELRVFEDLLEKMFFSADELVLDLLRNKRYSDMRAELRQFSEY